MSTARKCSKSLARRLGASGAYRHHVPWRIATTWITLIQRSEFLTTYTPYQPEIAQGTLQYAVRVPDPGRAMLTGMEVANASMYDGSTGTAPKPP
jgi:glycine dehydrogenase subunit 1